MFEKFNLLPVEIRHLIWTYAAFCERPQVIRFALTHTFDHAMRFCNAPWKHMFPSSEFNQSLFLLHTCKESRRIALISGAYSKKMDLEYSPWNSAKKDYLGPDTSVINCQHEDRLEAFKRQIYWKPHSDVVYVREEFERTPCVPNSACNFKTVMAEHEVRVKIDKRVKYIAFDIRVWNGKPRCSHFDGAFEAEGLEACYVIVSKEWFRDYSSLKVTARSQKVVDIAFERECLRLGRHVTAVMQDVQFHRGPISSAYRPEPAERDEIEVKFVETLEDVVRDIEERKIYQELCAVRESPVICIPKRVSSPEVEREIDPVLDTDFGDSNDLDDLFGM